MANRLIELQTELARHKAPPPVRARAGAHPVTRPQGLSTGRVARHARALTQRIDYAVAGTVPAIAQPSSMTCWAAATTILMSWRAGRRLDIGETMAEIGTYWRNLLDADQGITTDDKVRFLRDADLEAQQDLNPSPEGWRAMLERYGPIWVTTWETAGIHGRIVYGIHGDGSAEGTQLDVVDPAGGRRYQADIATFLPKFERETARAGRALRVQLVHLNEAKPSSHSLRRRLVQARGVRRARALSAVDYDVPGIVPALAQPSSMTCWATSFTMMYSWKEALSMPIPTALAAVGKSYVDMFKANKGLPVDQVDAFAATAGLGKRPPVSTSVEGYLGLLQDFGPLWVTTDEAPGKPWALHARIIKGIHGDGTADGTRFSMVDPNGGREYEETIAVFVPKFQELVINAGYAGTQIVHWPAGARLAAERTISAARALHTGRIARALSDSPGAERLARRVGAKTETRVKELLAGGVPEAEIQAFLLQLFPAAVVVPIVEAKSRPLARAMVVQEGTTVTLPGGTILEGWKAGLLVDMVSATYPWLALLLPALQELCNRLGVTVGLGPAVGAGAALGPAAGLGLGAGILIAPGNKIGVYGALEALQGGAALGASAVLQVTVVKDDESRFKGRAYTVGASIGEGYVGGGRLLLDKEHKPVGLIGEIGVGVGSPLQIVGTIQETVTSLSYGHPRAFAAPSSAVAVAGHFGPEVVAKVEELKAEGVEDEDITAFLESLTPEAPRAQTMGYARALDGAPQQIEVHLPGATVFTGWRAQLFVSLIETFGTILTAGATGRALSVSTMLRLADQAGMTLGLGPAIGGGLGVGGSFGAGLLLAPRHRIGFYGSYAFLAGALASIQVTAQATVVHGGPEVFGGKATARGVGISGPGISPTVGAFALFNDKGFIGVTAEIGIGAGISPFEALVSFQYTTHTVDALAFASGNTAPASGGGTPGPTVTHPVIAQIFDHIRASGLVEYSWKDRGRAPIGYLKGMALAYARVYCKYKLEPGEPENWRDRFCVKMAKGIAPGANAATDAIARYANTFMGFGADVSIDGVAVLRALFTILFGLGMRESSGKHCVGWDRGKLTGWGDPTKAKATTATTSEAGLFQMSYDIGLSTGDFKDLFEQYKQRPTSGFLDFFSEGVTCNLADAENFGTGVGQEFQKFSKECPAFTVELAALALRTRANHWGPINMNTVELRRECWSLLLGVETAMDDLGGCVAVV